MKLESHLPKQSFWLYLGPVLNVLLVLLIFFLLGSTFIIQSGVNVKLPQSGSKLAGFDRAHVITMTAGGDTLLYFDGQPVTLDQLRRQLDENKTGSRRVIIHADEMTAFGRVQQVANMSLGLGYEVAYATQPLF